MDQFSTTTIKTNKQITNEYNNEVIVTSSIISAVTIFLKPQIA